MINARAPSFVIRVNGNFYYKLSGLVRWKGAFCNEFKIRSGTRQEGILSAVLYNLLIIDVICIVKVIVGYGLDIGSKYQIVCY